MCGGGGSGGGDGVWDVFLTLTFFPFRVNIDTYNMLLSMGFKKGASREALRQANNNLSSALEVSLYILVYKYCVA